MSHPFRVGEIAETVAHDLDLNTPEFAPTA
jgi:hypothetical protein